MILKEREIPLLIHYFEALLRRLPRKSNLRSKIEENLLKAWAGYHGECKADRHISTIDNNHDTFILNDLCLPISNSFFQIDTLILTSKYLLILEIKNIAGSLEFDNEFEQFSRSLNGEIKGFPNPISQANRSKIHLKQWFHKKKLPTLPIEFLVVFTNSSSIITSVNQNEMTKNKAIKIDNLVAKYLTIQRSYSSIPPFLELKEQRRIANQLIKDHSPYSNYKRYPEEILSGVRCIQCEQFNMVRKIRSWYCNDCGLFDKNAHQQALYDYLLLVNPTISNQQAREFLGVESSRVSYRLLNLTNLTPQGKGKGRTYSFPENHHNIF
ncbi:nuclease-related domain-containing protein [Bacillus sp. BHET2]|uniref:nuclease-related domain-containing protein n=1 Tax=Bacillus sp. BHET2 TaxID=2583818 RepID=UPI001486B5E7|nr:nuclease-related domain-containing protein [Bacillus sp. BHET2]